jgi:DNA polymerase II small subunit
VDSDSLLKYGWEAEEDAKVNVNPVEETKERPSAQGETAQKKITDTFLGSGILLSGLAVDLIKQRDIKPKKIIDLAREKSVFLVTKEFIQEFFPEEKKEEFSFVVKKGKPAAASQIESQLQIDKSKDVTGNSTSEGTVENFIELFRDRFKRLKSILTNRVNLRDVIDINNIGKYQDREVKVVGMIREMRRSKNNNLIIEIEDPTGTAIVIDTSESNQRDAGLTNDEVIGVVGTVKGELILAKEVIEPDIPITKQQPECEDPIAIAFLLDIHVGSLLFKEREFQKFMDWLNLSGNVNRREVAQSIKYLFIAGDLVDGIGIYPGQESELSIPDIYKQYDYFVKLLEQVPSYMEVVISAGNHDAVRRCEPQPSLAEFLEPLTELPNFHLVGNPARVRAHGFDVLAYHGTSMDALISSMSHLSYDKPERAQIEYLKKRHLSPIYGTKEQIAPEEKDYMAMDFVPDIFHCGHVHKNGYANYRGVTVINSGTWQAQTDYQQQQGHMPTPCQVPILDLRAHQLRVINFA